MRPVPNWWRAVWSGERTDSVTLRRRLRIAAFASHGGSNLQAMLDAIAAGTLPADVVVVVGNNSTATALERARRAGIPTVHLSSQTHPDVSALDAATLAVLRAHEADIVCLAGYMKLLGPRTVAAYEGRILNIHPALLPRFGGSGMYGRRVHEAVLRAGAAESGASVHVVDQSYDHGPVLAQATVPVLAGDDADTLAARVLVAEHRLYVETLRQIAEGIIGLPRA